MTVSIRRLIAALTDNFNRASRTYVRQAFDRPWLREFEAKPY